MENNKSLFYELLIDGQNFQDYKPLLTYHGYGKGDIDHFDICFLMYGKEILDSFFVPKSGSDVRLSVVKISDVFRHVSIENIWDVAFCLSVYREVVHDRGGDFDSVQKLFNLIEERKISESQYAVFVQESHGVFIWQFQIANFLQLFFESYQVAMHFTKSFNTKRVSDFKRLNEVTMSNKSKLGDYILSHSLGNSYGRPGLVTAHRIWNVLSGESYVSHNIDEILSHRD